MISRTVLVVAEAFPAGLGAARVTAAIGRGLGAPPPRGSGPWAVELLALDRPGPRGALGELAGRSPEPGADGLPGRLRVARAVVLAAAELESEIERRDAVFQLATAARQGGIPAYAITAGRAVDLFAARLLDLQVVLRAATVPALVRAGRRLAEVI